MNTAVYGASSGTLYHASDCTVQAGPKLLRLVHLGKSSKSGFAFTIDTYTLSGEQWPYYPY